MGGAVPAAGGKPGFTAGVATGAVGTGAGAFALFQMVPIGKILTNNGSYIAMLDGAALLALVALCSLLLYGQLKDRLLGNKLSTLNVIVYVLAAVVLLDVSVLGVKAMIEKTFVPPPPLPPVSEQFDEYNDRVINFHFSHDEAKAPDEELKLVPKINAVTFNPDGTLKFALGDRMPVIFELQHLEQLEAAHNDLKTAYKNLRDKDDLLHKKCIDEVDPGRLSKGCTQFLMTYLWN